jgi:hypothetical protein
LLSLSEIITRRIERGILIIDHFRVDYHSPLLSLPSFLLPTADVYHLIHALGSERVGTSHLAFSSRTGGAAGRKSRYQIMRQDASLAPSRLP